MITFIVKIRTRIDAGLLGTIDCTWNKFKVNEKRKFGFGSVAWSLLHSQVVHPSHFIWNKHLKFLKIFEKSRGHFRRNKSLRHDPTSWNIRNLRVSIIFVRSNWPFFHVEFKQSKRSSTIEKISEMDARSFNLQLYPHPIIILVSKCYFRVFQRFQNHWNGFVDQSIGRWRQHDLKVASKRYIASKMLKTD